VEAGESVAVVGETGSGKTTLAKALLGLAPVDAGTVRAGGRELGAMGAAERKAFRARHQMVFQQPIASLDPHFTVEEILREPLIVHRVPGPDHGPRVDRCLEAVGLPREVLGKVPSRLSGGQRQRVAIARGLVLGPAFMVLDEPVSALDLSVQAQVLHLLADLKRDRGLTYLLISHDLGVVEFLCERVAVMLHGVVVEEGPTAAVLGGARHPYTRRLLAARLPSAPGAEAGTAGTEAEPAPVFWDEQPPLKEVEPGHWAAPDGPA
jgi:peptide/nickel transport system ATP-binding protein